MGKAASSQPSQAANPAGTATDKVRPISVTAGPSSPPTEGDQRLHRAIDGRLHAKLGAAFDGRDLTYLTRMVCRDPDRPDAFWTQFMKGDRPVLMKLLEAKAPVEVGLTFEGKRVVFASRLLDRNNHLWVDGIVKVEGLLLAWPEQFEEVQRRTNPRLTLPPSSGISVKLFRTDGFTATPGVYKDGADLNAELWDLSRGGACFLCPFTKSILDISQEEPLAVSINYYGTRLTLEARLTYRRTLSGAVRLGVKFVRGAHESPGSNDALQRVVEELEGRLHHRLFASVRKKGVA